MDEGGDQELLNARWELLAQRCSHMKMWAHKRAATRLLPFVAEGVIAVEAHVERDGVHEGGMGGRRDRWRGVR